MIKLRDILNEASPHETALSQTEQEALTMVAKNWNKFTGEVCNTGFCDVYARKLSKLLPGAVQMSTEETGANKSFGHVWVKYKSKYYDAEVPKGVADWKQLPWMKAYYRLNKSYPKDIEILK